MFSLPPFDSRDGIEMYGYAGRRVKRRSNAVLLPLQNVSPVLLFTSMIAAWSNALPKATACAYMVTVQMFRAGKITA